MWSMVDRCQICDRNDCATLRSRHCADRNCTRTRRGPALHRCEAMGLAYDDCRAHAVDWRARALAAEAVVEAVRQHCAAEAPHLDDCLTHCHPAAHCTCGADIRDDERLHFAELLPPKERANG